MSSVRDRLMHLIEGKTSQEELEGGWLQFNRYGYIKINHAAGKAKFLQKKSDLKGKITNFNRNLFEFTSRQIYKHMPYSDGEISYDETTMGELGSERIPGMAGRTNIIVASWSLDLPERL